MYLISNFYFSFCFCKLISFFFLHSILTVLSCFLLLLCSTLNPLSSLFSLFSLLSLNLGSLTLLRVSLVSYSFPGSVAYPRIERTSCHCSVLRGSPSTFPSFPPPSQLPEQRPLPPSFDNSLPPPL